MCRRVTVTSVTCPVEFLPSAGAQTAVGVGVGRRPSFGRVASASAPPGSTSGAGKTNVSEETGSRVALPPGGIDRAGAAKRTAAKHFRGVAPIAASPWVFFKRNRPRRMKKYEWATRSFTKRSFGEVAWIIFSAYLHPQAEKIQTRYHVASAASVM